MIEDDEEIAELLSEYLNRYNIEVTNYNNPEIGVLGLALKKFDIVILDLSLPNIDGTEVCKMIRDKSDIPIIISSARSDISDKATCFALGADDYLPKPYNTHELVLRINSILKRYNNNANEKISETSKVFEYNEAKMEIKKFGKYLNLTNGEYNILAYLIKKSGYSVSREELLTNVESINYESSLKSIDVLIGRIRLKIEDNQKKPKYLISIRGIGYKLVNE